MAKRTETPKKHADAKKTGTKTRSGNATAQATSLALDEALAAQRGEIVEFEEAQALLKTTRSTLYRWIRQGRLRALKAGRQWRFRREDLRRFLEGESAELALPVSIQPFLDALRAQTDQVTLGRPLLSCEPVPKETRRGQVPRVGAPDSPETSVPGAGAETALLRQAANRLLSLAVRLDASDIHITPNRSAAGQIQAPVRLRLNGLLRTVTMLDPRLLAHVVKDWKILSGCDPQETVRPQEGHIRLDLHGGSFDFRCCFLPSSLGESMVARVFRVGEDLVTLEQCGFLPDERKRIEEAVRAPNGLVLFTGPMGSGKSTVMLAALGCLDARESSILSIEMSPSSLLPWVTPIGAGDEKGLPVHTALQYAMKADPDVIACGDIRDLDTLHAAMELVETGHLLLATLFADSATQALLRMVEMGESPRVLGWCVRFVLFQRLKRIVCPDCVQPAKLDANRRKRFERILTAGGVDPTSLPSQFREGKGCPKCGGTGFRGRSAFGEMLTMTPRLAEALREPSVDPVAFRALAVSEGMIPWDASLVRHAYEGVTSIREVERLLG